MSNAFDRYAEARVTAQAKELAIALIKDKIYPLSKIAELTKLSIEEVTQLAGEQLHNA